MLSYFLVAAALEGVVPTEVVTAILQAMDCHPTSGKMLTQGCLALGNVARAGEPVHADMPLSPCTHATCMYTCPSPHAHMQHACTHAPLPMHTCNMHVHMPLSPRTHATCMHYQKAMVYKRGFVKIWLFQIPLKKKWSIVRPFCQKFSKWQKKPWSIVRDFSKNLKFLIKGYESVNWVLLNISPRGLSVKNEISLKMAKKTMVYSKGFFQKFGRFEISHKRV